MIVHPLTKLSMLSSTFQETLDPAPLLGLSNLESSCPPLSSLTASIEAKDCDVNTDAKVNSYKCTNQKYWGHPGPNFKLSTVAEFCFLLDFLFFQQLSDAIFGYAVQGALHGSYRISICFFFAFGLFNLIMVVQ